MSFTFSTHPALSRDIWERLVTIFQYFPLVTVFQWVGTFYPAGKTSIKSRLNLPGKVAWITMELPGPLMILYCLYSIPTKIFWKELPPERILLATLYTIHYLNRAIIGPYLNPSMSPIHLSVWVSAILFQTINGISIGGYLAGYDSIMINSIPKLSEATTKDFSGTNHILLERKTIFNQPYLLVGILIWTLGFISNIFHDEILRDIRRDLRLKQMQRTATFHKKGQEITDSDQKAKISLNKFYRIPSRGLFRWILFPHYLCEWFEWIGWWIIAGPSCLPARIFLINLVATMTPRAVQGRNWYVKNFGEEKLYGRKAIIPGIL